MRDIIQSAEILNTQRSKSLMEMDDNIESSEGPDELKLPQ